MMRIYRAPDGRTYQYEEGTQPNGFVEAKATPQPKNKARVPSANKRKTRASGA